MDKPLHVQVAEALGCKLRLIEQTPAVLGSYWTCGCPEFQSHGNLHGCHRYDTDWSATGPLIEKHNLHLRPQPWWPRADQPEKAWEARAYLTKPEHREEAIYGEPGSTPLIAVCNLILALAKEGKL